MIDDNWELINGEEAHEIEVLNYANQVNVIEALIRLLKHNHGIGSHGSNAVPNENVLRELHRTGTLFLLNKPGQYRDCDVHVRSSDGDVVYEPPAWEEVPGHMRNFFSELKELWIRGDPIYVSAFVLWKINWIHPFRNGNGRTARAFAYACLCLKIGALLPGSPTVIEQIMAERDKYNSALAHADKSFKQSGVPDLAPMSNYIEKLLRVQLSGL